MYSTIEYAIFPSLYVQELDIERFWISKKERAPIFGARKVLLLWFLERAGRGYRPAA
jgi:hypothetical protein